MNVLTLTSLFFMFLFYVVSLNNLYGAAFILFGLTLVFMGMAIYMEAKKVHVDEDKHVPYLRLVK
ncbi:hypothetical protein [Oceanobacillus halophilus]|uniref:Uncharacterized protein n=1 Tax=Oceanobacillus halophilus TaxID=930130 RepID=A0A494ZXP0_9BACI|nr:hypothetical protein [Oceanobacillus halophilus]RKQ31344.1 hypothetical protein D8M06_13865 [Oceanobacillus halophilus]